ncbi:MAG: hypothetical protein HQM11_05155 [SAR324 cluster bacterium]|nr:hypothetical protein [SAR324 cluster bacterium]
MKSLIDKAFSLKIAYFFQNIANEELRNYFYQELHRQLTDLEKIWSSIEYFDDQQLNSQELEDYQYKIERLLFRLEEIQYFIETTTGPAIVKFICSEIGNLVSEKRFLGTKWTAEEKESIGVVFTVMNTFYLPEVMDLTVHTVDDVSKALRTAMQPLLTDIL